MLKLPAVSKPLILRTKTLSLAIFKLWKESKIEVSIGKPSGTAQTIMVTATVTASTKYLIEELKDYGFQTDDVHQGENLTPVIREFEGIIKDGNFKIADNNLLKTHFLNVALKHNMETRKFRPIKIEQRAHIDGFVSIIDAMTVRQKYWEECGELLKNAA